MKLIVGLGNPGKEYEKTRHNVGFLVLDTLLDQAQSSACPPKRWKEAGRGGVRRGSKAKKWGKNKALESKIYDLRFTDYDLLLAKPLTFMNDSGQAVEKLVGHFPVRPDSLLVVHDDLDLKLGSYKLQLGKGPKGHKGLLSVEKTLGTKAFWRLRVGVDNREAGGWRLEAGSSKLEAGSWKLEAGSSKLEAGSSKLEAGSSKLEAGSWKLEARSSKLEAGGEEYVLGNFRPKELEVIKALIKENIIPAIKDWVSG